MGRHTRAHALGKQRTHLGRSIVLNPKLVYLGISCQQKDRDGNSNGSCYQYNHDCHAQSKDGGRFMFGQLTLDAFEIIIIGISTVRATGTTFGGMARTVTFSTAAAIVVITINVVVVSG
jgi:hypothetical protein